MTVAADDLVTPIDRYLAEQQGATAVERFARRHDADLVPAGERWYADRLPTSAPSAGQQYAFRVDLDQCTGCKSCVAACHSLNGLDEHESWRSVGLLVGQDPERPRAQTVPSGCHHCVEPACLSGCPTNAYEKDPISGIVRHLDDQCIGCGYCELTCPYEVPKLNRRLGIVRKCDLCADRLADGEAPACVQACPTSAITVTVVDTQEVRIASASGTLVPGAPESAITTPTTQYVGAVPLDDDLVAADRHAVHLSRSHPPLAFMLVVTQLSVGAFLATLVADRTLAGGLPAGGAAGAAGAGLVALAGSVLHLGRPAVAWRALLGIRHSWLSREILAFTAYAGFVSAYAAVQFVEWVPSGVSVALALAGAVTGAAGVACSALLYVATRRTWWRAGRTFTKFVGTTAITGPLAVTVVFLAASTGQASVLPEVVLRDVVVTAASVTVAATIVKLTSEALVLWPHRWPDGSDLAGTARLLLGPLAARTRMRFALGILGGVVGPLAMVAIVVDADADAPTAALVVLSFLSLAFAVAGELIERYQFFVASVTPRMPGGLRR